MGHSWIIQSSDGVLVDEILGFISHINAILKLLLDS